MIVEKPIKELAPGHYVVDIVEQDGTYQLKKPGHIKNQAVISHLAKRGVRSILIDTSKTLISIHKGEDGNHIFRKDDQDAAFPEPLTLDFAKAKSLFSQSKKIQRQYLYDIINGKDLDIEPVQEITDQTVDAIFKNPDAMACVLNIRNKDEYLLEHSVSVSILMAIFARHLNFDRQIARELSIGAFLHDVGKIRIPDEILNKPTKLTPEEFKIMQTHVNHSIDIIQNTPGISELSQEVAALHHEKLNGKGYPYQLANDDISQYGRMITICDIFDALTADRVYKSGYCHVKAFNILRKLGEAGELDTSLVNRFIKCMGVYPVGSLVELNSHKLAIVEARNPRDPINPKVRSFYNIDYRHYTMAEDIDLSEDEDFIVKSVRANEFNLEMNKIVEFLMLQG
ncbi:HD-GYP domain-containing protein [Thalassotalea euphylliae]|uniref:HD-GYP domain-containing protein n=1 Tax=Thalassotalea euphylliae TaxID=1655234 RepID=UPI0036252A80